MRLLLGVTAATLLVYLALCAALFVFQRSLLYFPPPPSLGSQDRTMTLPVHGARVVASVRAHGRPNAVIYFGGNGEDVTLSATGLSEAFPDDALYLLHYRGYGGSSGTPSETAIVADALALFDVAHAEHQSVVVIGRSLGSGVAVRVASLRPASRLVLVTPYDSLQAIAAARYALFPVKWLMRDRFESSKYAPSVIAPTLLLAAENDEIIPRASTDLLLSRFSRGLAALEVVGGVDHNSISEHPRYPKLLRQFVASGRAAGATKGQ
jgi:pimeloyl-ACP methyl ester carboxylesterase